MKKIDNPSEESFDLYVYNLLVIAYRGCKREVFDLSETDVERVSLKHIAENFGDNGYLLVIAESPLDGTIYRYNSYGEKEWIEAGKMCGYA